MRNPAQVARDREERARTPARIEAGIAALPGEGAERTKAHALLCWLARLLVRLVEVTSAQS